MTLDEPIALQELTNQVLPELRFDAGGKLVCPIAPALSSSTARKLSLRQLANFKAALYWLQDYQPLAHANNLERVRGLLEAFHHLSQLSAWQAAYDLLHISIPPSQLEQADQPGRSLPLHKQLEIWGHYQELTNLYSTLLSKLSAEIEGDCCNRLGQIYRLWGKFLEGITFHERSLTLAEQLGDFTLAAKAHLGLANIDLNLERSISGVVHAEIALNLAYQLSEISLQAESLLCLSNLYIRTGSAYYKPRLGLRCAQEGLSLAQTLQDTSLQCHLLSTLGEVYLSLGKQQEAIEFYQQGLDLAQTTGDLYQQWITLQNFSFVYLHSRDLEQSRSLLLEAIEIAHKLHNPYCKASVLQSQITFNHAYADPNNSQAGFQEMMELARQSGNSFQEWLSLKSLAVFLLRGKEFEQAKVLLDKAEVISRTQRFRSIFMTAIDSFNTSYCLSSLGDWQGGLRYGKKSLAAARRHKSNVDWILAILVIAYAYWQGNRRLRGLLLLLRYLPQALVSAIRDEATRYSLKVTAEVVSEPIFTVLRKLWRFLQLQPRD